MKTVNIDGREYRISGCRKCPLYSYGIAGMGSRCQYPVTPGRGKGRDLRKYAYEGSPMDCPLKEVKG